MRRRHMHTVVRRLTSQSNESGSKRRCYTTRLYFDNIYTGLSPVSQGSVQYSMSESQLSLLGSLSRDEKDTM